MQHCDDDVLALVALGEQPSADDARHLAMCAACRSEVASFDRVLVAGRPGAETGADVEPPARVWEGIAAATGVTARPRTIPTPSAPGDVDRRWSDGPEISSPFFERSGRGRRAATGPEAPAGDHAQGRPARPARVDGPAGERVAAALPSSAPQRAGDGVVTPFRSRRAERPARARGRLPMIAVAASALVVGGAGGAGTMALLDRDPAPVVQVVASTTLDPLPADPQATGTAMVVDTQGRRVLEVDVSRLTRTGGFYEVWLIDADVKRMVPIGILSGARGEFTIPEGLNLGEYPVVDISVEPLDGDPTHSGTSLLRGTIST